MIHTLLRTLAIVACLLFGLIHPVRAYAGESAVGVGAGTLGAALSLSQAIDPQTAIRLTYGTFDLGRRAEFDNVVIDVQTNLRLSESFRVRSAGLYVDRLVGPTIHVTIGAVINQNHISAISVPADSSLIINHYVYSAAQAGEVFTDVKWMPLSPYIGFVFQPRDNRRHRLSFVAEVGAFYEGPATVTFDANGAIKANQSRFTRYFDTLKSQLSRELAPVQVFPVLELGVRMRM